jgi:toxin ParE1/3/4
LKRLPVRWLEPASLDLIEMAASKMGRDILLAAERLSRQPRVGKVVPELHEQGISEYRQVYVGPYRIIYSLEPDSIDVLAVLDGRRDTQAALFQRLIR